MNLKLSGGRFYSKLNEFNYARWTRDPQITRVVREMRKQFFPVPSESEQAKRKGKKMDAGLPLNEAIHQLMAKAQEGQYGETDEMFFEAKCNLAGENANGVRGVLSLAHTLARPGETSILVICPEPLWDQARKAGATFVGSHDIVHDVIEEKIRFERCIATVDQMPLLAKLARYLGPKGLMPNTKTGTLTTDVVLAIRTALTNSPFKVDRENAIFRMAIARPSFSEAKLRENLKIVMDYLQTQNKTTDNGKFVESAVLGIKDYILPLSRDEYSQTSGPRFLVVLEKHRAQVASREKLYHQQLLLQSQQARPRTH